MTGPKTHYTEPRAGSRVARCLTLMRQSQGVTNHELGFNVSRFMVPYLRDQCGYDVRMFRATGKRDFRKNGLGRQPLIYRIVGRSAWNGDYEDYLA